VIDEGVVDLGIEGVDAAPQAWRWERVTIGVDLEGVDKGS
jgi:hypothetical protein